MHIYASFCPVRNASIKKYVNNAFVLLMPLFVLLTNVDQPGCLFFSKYSVLTCVYVGFWFDSSARRSIGSNFSICASRSSYHFLCLREVRSLMQSSSSLPNNCISNLALFHLRCMGIWPFHQVAEVSQKERPVPCHPLAMTRRSNLNLLGTLWYTY